MEPNQKFDTGKIIITVVLILVTAGLFLAIGYWAGVTTGQTASTKTSSLTSATAVASKTSASATATTTKSGWKTYTSDYGFKIKYPSVWTPDDEEKTSVSFYTPEDVKRLAELKAQQTGTEGPMPQALVVYYSSLKEADGNNPPKYSSLEEMVNDTTIFNNTKATTYAGQSAYETIESGMGDDFEYIMERNGHIYKVRIPNKSSKSDLTATEQSVLSSFEFTN